MDADFKLDLTEKGTRYDHYVELKEAFATGIAVIDGMSPQYLSPSDKQLRVKLIGAVEVIDKRLMKLSDYNGKMQAWGNLPRDMAEAAKKGTAEGERFKREQKLLTAGGSNGKHEAVNQEGPAKDSQEPPDEPIGV